MIIVPDGAAHVCLKRFESLGDELEYPSGTRLFQQETRVRDVYFITGGFIKLIRLEVDGNEAFLGLRSAGSLLGAGAVSGGHHQFDAFAVTTCRLFRMPTEQFWGILYRDPQFSVAVHELRISAESAHVEQYARLACWSSRMRLLGFFFGLLQTGQMVRHGDNGDVYLRLPLKIREVAQYLAITPAHMSRVLTQLEVEGFVLRRRGWIVLPSKSVSWIRDGIASKSNKHVNIAEGNSSGPARVAAASQQSHLAGAAKIGTM